MHPSFLTFYFNHKLITYNNNIIYTTNITYSTRITYNTNFTYAFGDITY